MNRRFLVGGVALAAAVTLLSIILLVSGMLMNQTAGLVFQVLATAMEIAAIIWVLRGTRHEKGFGGQFAMGLLTALIAAVLLFGATFLQAAMFPGQYEALKDYQAGMMEQQGVQPEQIEMVLSAYTVIQAASGAFATMVVGLVVSLISAIFIRRKGDPDYA